MSRVVDKAGRTECGSGQEGFTVNIDNGRAMLRMDIGFYIYIYIERVYSCPYYSLLRIHVLLAYQKFWQ